MPDGELIRSLLRSHVHKDEASFRRAAEELIAQERRLNHRLLADDLERILLNGHSEPGGRRPVAPAWQIPKDKERGLPLVSISQPDVPWASVILPSENVDALQQCTRENRQRDLLAHAGVLPKQKVLLFGPPGCGKTLSASALAFDLGWPLATVRLDSLMSSFLGETATNLRRIFEFIASAPFVVLFDECDAIAKERAAGNEHGELQRVVTALLQMLDGFTGQSILVFATNHQQLLDSALWRRFDLVLRLNLPEPQDRIIMLKQFLRPISHEPKLVEKQARAMRGASGADLYWFAQELIRRCILEGRSTAGREDFAYVADALAVRYQALGQNGLIENPKTPSTRKARSSSKTKSHAKRS